MVGGEAVADLAADEGVGLPEPGTDLLEGEPPRARAGMRHEALLFVRYRVRAIPADRITAGRDTIMSNYSLRALLAFAPVPRRPS
ncbi:hypothetical protein GCM10027445_30230 [Amycolatopsis endophytica]